MTFGVVSGGSGRIWLGYGIADVERLKAEIAHRTIHSRTKSWAARQRVRKTR
jgi:hypothetical protein